VRNEAAFLTGTRLVYTPLLCKALVLQIVKATVREGEVISPAHSWRKSAARKACRGIGTELRAQDHHIVIRSPLEKACRIFSSLNSVKVVIQRSGQQKMFLRNRHCASWNPCTDFPTPAPLFSLVQYFHPTPLLHTQDSDVPISPERSRRSH
jgi:hypothetical protein